MPGLIGNQLGVRQLRHCTAVRAVMALGCVCLVWLHASQQLDHVFSHAPAAATSAAPKMPLASALSQPFFMPSALAIATRKEATPSSGYTWATVTAALGFVALIAHGTDKNSKGSAFAGGGCSVINVGDQLSAQHVDPEGTEPPRVVMYGKNPRKYVRPSERTRLDWARHARRNSAAKQRFLFKPDGTVWRKQPGLNHLKSKKSVAKRKRLSKMVQLTKGENKRVWKMTGKRARPQRADEMIMRKFNSQRLREHLGLSDHGWGTALFTPSKGR